MKKKLGIAAMLAVVMLAGCVPGSSSEKPSALPEDSTKTEVPADSQTGGSTEPLRVGIMPSAVGAPVQYAQENGYFEEEGLTVETVIFQSGAPINEAIAAEQIDIAVSGRIGRGMQWSRNHILSGYRAGKAFGRCGSIRWNGNLGKAG